MAIQRLRFVDSIAASPTVLFDLNDRVSTHLEPGFDFGVPEMNRQILSSLARDGGSVPVSAYGLRQVTLPVLLQPTSRNNYATLLQNLGRILDKGMSLLEWQPDPGVASVFWRILRSPQHEIVDALTRPTSKPVTLRLLAEPFALGLPETPVNAVSVSMDPAVAVTGGVGGQVVEFTVIGDVATPASIKVVSSTWHRGQQVVAVRRRGNPTALERVRQAEALTAATDTSIQSHSAVFSGAGSNYMRTTFAGFAGDAVRLSGNINVTSSAEHRGTYRMFVRVRRNGSSSTLKIHWEDATGGTAKGPVKTVPAGAGSFITMDLGLFTLPFTRGPATDGFSGTAYAVGPTPFYLNAERVGGTDTLDWDYVTLVPADEELAISSVSTATGSPNSREYDGPNDIVWGGAGNAFVFGRAGAIPLLQPGVTNHLRVLDRVGIDAGMDAATVTVKYWPRYLHGAP